jgi:hypothetical protein
MQLATYHASTTATWAEALFASVLQRSDRPSPGQVRKAIAAVVRTHGSRGCAGLVAQEFGDHPETAAERMCWARAVVVDVFAAPLGPAQDSARARPGLSAIGPPSRQLAMT